MNTLILTKARLVSSGIFSKTYLTDLKKRDQLWVLPIAGAGILTGAGVMLFMLIGNYRAILNLGLNTGQPEILLLISGIMSSILLFLVGTPLCLSNVFYSKDNQLIVPLPVTTAQIAASRLITVYLFLLPIHLLLNIPAVILYFTVTDITAGGAAAAAGLLLFGPLLPMIMALLASAVLSAAADLSGHRMLFEILGMAIALIILGTAQLSFGRAMLSEGDFNRITEILTDNMKTLQKIFFISNWAASGFRSGGILFTLAGAGLPVAAGAGAIVLMKKWRLNLTDRVEKTSRKKQRSTPDAVATVPLSEPGSPGKALLKREWSIICSNSSFLMEVIGEVAVLPILLLVFFFTIPEDYFSMFREMLGTITFTPLIALAALIFFSSINSVSSTSLSREGATFSLSKALPASGRQQVKAKMFLHLLLFLPAWYLNMIIMMTILGLSPINLIYLIPAGPAAIILGFISNIHIDLSRPVLTWNHPQQAMKQNMNVPIGMGFSILTAGGLSVIGLLVYFAGAGIIPAGIIAAAAAAAADFILLPKLMNYADRRYGEISP